MLLNVQSDHKFWKHAATGHVRDWKLDPRFEYSISLIPLCFKGHRGRHLQLNAVLSGGSKAERMATGSPSKPPSIFRRRCFGSVQLGMQRAAQRLSQVPRIVSSLIPTDACQLRSFLAAAASVAFASERQIYLQRGLPNSSHRYGIA